MKRCKACGTETNLVSSLGGVLLCQTCRPQIEIEIAGSRDAGQEVDVTVMADRLHDNSTERVQRRNEALNAKAKALGFDSLSQMLTSWKNGQIELIVNKTE